MTFVFFLLFPCYLWMSRSVQKNAALQLVAIMSLFLLAPFILTICVFVYEIQLDYYCGYFSILLAVLDIIAAKNVLKYWKEGDF